MATRALAPLALSALEVAVGSPLTKTAPPPPRPPVAPAGAGESPGDALRAVLLAALMRPPAMIAFSGGRDSSLLLAVAVAVAREHGLPLPIPLTYRHPGPATDEREWQELVIRHLDLEEWVVVTGDTELDFLGAIAREGLLRHGVQFPPNAHFVRFMAQQALGGTLVLGGGGDELLDSWRWVGRADLLARRARPSARHLSTFLLGSAPVAVRQRYITHRLRRYDPAWLTPLARRRLKAYVVPEAYQPPRWDEFVWWSLTEPVLQAVQHVVAIHTADLDVTVEHPFLAERFCSALAATGGRTGWSGRTEIMRVLGARYLPPELLSRPTKALFWDVYFGPHTRAFAERWSQQFEDPELATLVDAAQLRHEWLAPRPDLRSALALQTCWLSTIGDKFAA